MSDWDDEGTNSGIAKKLTGVWDDDEADAVPESWDAPENKPEPKPTKPAPTKPSLADRIKVKEEQRRKDKEEKLKREEETRNAKPASELEREKLAEEAELGLLMDTFGPEAAGAEVKIGAIDQCQPRTKEDFNRLNELLREKLMSIDKSPHYAAFAEILIRDTMAGMDIDSLKSVSTSITAFITEKQKLVKNKGKKKSKNKLMVERENDYNVEGEDEADQDEFEDFM